MQTEFFIYGTFHTFAQRIMKNQPIANNAITAGLVSIIFKMIYFIWFYPNDILDNYVRFAYLLVFLLALFFGLRNWKSNNEGSSLVSDIKSGLKIASIYAIILSAFTYIYYKLINPAYFEERIAKALQLASESGEDLSKVRDTASFIFDAFFHSTITLFGLIAIGFFYTVVLVALFRTKPEFYRN